MKLVKRYSPSERIVYHKSLENIETFSLDLIYKLTRTLNSLRFHLHIINSNNNNNNNKRCVTSWKVVTVLSGVRAPCDDVLRRDQPRNRK